MEHSDALSMWRSKSRPARLARFAVPLVLVLIGLTACNPLAGLQDVKEFDKAEAAFDADPGAFMGVIAHMEQLKAAHPDAERLVWTNSLFCVTPAGEAEVCTPASDADDQAFEPLPNSLRAFRVSFYAKDPDRIFIGFNLDPPPILHVMYAPHDTHPGDFAKDRGFRSWRELAEGWTLLGSIPDPDVFDEQFPN